MSWWLQLLVFCPRAHGDTQHCRKALHRAVQCTSDYPEHVCEVLLTMERTEGGTLTFSFMLGPHLLALGLQQERLVTVCEDTLWSWYHLANAHSD